MNNEPPTATAENRGHEPPMSSVRNVFIIAGSVVTMLAICLFSAHAFLLALSTKRPMQPVQSLGILTARDNRALTHLPAPNLELDDGHADQAALSARQNELLHSYGWVDRRHGVARIPIDRAMDLIAARGLPTDTNGAAPGDSSKLRLAGKEP
jgi:hypothetical protein